MITHRRLPLLALGALAALALAGCGSGSSSGIGIRRLRGGLAHRSRDAQRRRLLPDLGRPCPPAR